MEERRGHKLGRCCLLRMIWPSFVPPCSSIEVDAYCHTKSGKDRVGEVAASRETSVLEAFYLTFCTLSTPLDAAASTPASRPALSTLLEVTASRSRPEHHPQVREKA